MGVFSAVKIHGTNFRCYGIEPPWLDNEVGKSCIPVGVYPIERGDHFTKPQAEWEVKNVPNRTVILFHRGNNMDDTEGCILLGVGLGWIQSANSIQPKWAVTNSRMAMTQFNQTLSNERLASVIVTNNSDAWRKP